MAFYFPGVSDMEYIVSADQIENEELAALSRRVDRRRYEVQAAQFAAEQRAFERRQHEEQRMDKLVRGVCKLSVLAVGLVAMRAAQVDGRIDGDIATPLLTVGLIALGWCARKVARIK